MASSEDASIKDKGEGKRTRGAGRGGGFFALDREVWEQLWAIETTNRLNLVIAYLVLLAGTGSDHRLTKWSAKACEDHAGLGKPRAKRSIEELIASGLVKRTDASTRLMPQYELRSLPREADPIFLPVALVTGLSGEASMLRRVRETGDPLALRIMIDLYGLVSLDATHAIPLECLNAGKAANGEATARKIAEVGAHAVWAFTRGTWRQAKGEWTAIHRLKASDPDVAWSAFWARVDLLKQIGAIWYEAWVFDGEDLDAEPLIPLDPSGYYSVASPTAEAELTQLTLEASRALVGEERSYLFDHTDADFYLPMTAHRRTPAYREVARLRVEADTPGRRLAWKRRRILIEQHSEALRKLIEDIAANTFNKPMQLGRDLGGLL